MNIRRQAIAAIVFLPVGGGSVLTAAAADSTASRRAGLHVIDWGVLVFYVAAILWIGWRASRAGKGKSTREYFLGDRRFTSFTIGISMFVTLFSTISYLSGPGEMIRYGPGMYFGQVIDVPFVYPLIGYWLIPALMKQRIISLYQFLETKLGPSIRTLGACMFILYRTVWMALLMHFAADALSVTLGFSPRAIPGITIVTGAIVIVYTAMGGLTAVMLIEVLQFFVLLFGVVAALIIVSLRFHGFGWFSTQWNPIWPAQPAFSWDATVRLTLLGATLRSGVLDVAHSVDQTQVQRYMASTDEKQARRSVIIRLSSFFVTWTFLALVGLALLAFYQRFPGSMPAATSISSYADRIFPYFIAHELPVGLSGLVAAAILAAGMSGVSSAVNSFAVVVLNDFIERRGIRKATEAERKRFAVLLSFAIGVVVVIFSLLIGLIPGNFVEVTSRTIQLFIPLELGIVLAALLMRFATPFAVFWGIIYGFVLGILISYWTVLTGHKGISFTLYMPCILGIQMVATSLISLLPVKTFSRGKFVLATAFLTALLIAIVTVVLRTGTAR